MQAHWNENAWFEKILLIGDLDIIDLYLKKHVNSQKKYRTFIQEVFMANIEIILHYYQKVYILNF